MGLSAPTWFPRDIHFLDLLRTCSWIPAMLWGSSSHTERPHTGALVCGPGLQVQAPDVMSRKEVISTTFGPSDWPTITTQRRVLTAGSLGQRCSLVSDSCNHMDCGLPGSSVCEIFPARRLEWVAICYSRGIFPTQGSNPHLLAGRFFTTPAM